MGLAAFAWISSRSPILNPKTGLEQRSWLLLQGKLFIIHPSLVASNPNQDFQLWLSHLGDNLWLWQNHESLSTC